MRLLLSLLAAVVPMAVFAPAQIRSTPHVHLAGDSTMADKPTDPPNPEYGWGQLLPRFSRNPR